jgi:plasmid stability protein
MADVLLRDVPDETLVALDARAARLGVSRAEYLRRVVAQAATPLGSCTAEDLRRTAEVFQNLGDPEVIKGAWPDRSAPES